MSRHIWNNNFQISQEENANFNQNTDNMVTKFINKIINIFTAYLNGDPNKLNNNHPIAYKITVDWYTATQNEKKKITVLVRQK